jgi:hypothetical protein
MARRLSVSVGLLCIFLLGSAGIMEAQFGPQPIYVGIPTAQFNFVAASQQQTEWCWAASTQMILGWYGIHVSQPEIVQRAYGSTGNYPGSDQAVSIALNGWGQTANGQFVTIRSAVYPGLPPPALLISQLSQEHPVLLGIVSGPTSGHAVVITAASYINSQWGPQITSLVIRDPWPSQQNVATDGREEYTGQSLTQFAATMRAYWLVTVQ